MKDLIRGSLCFLVAVFVCCSLVGCCKSCKCKQPTCPCKPCPCPCKDKCPCHPCKPCHPDHHGQPCHPQALTSECSEEVAFHRPLRRWIHHRRHRHCHPCYRCEDKRELKTGAEADPGGVLSC